MEKRDEAQLAIQECARGEGLPPGSDAPDPFAVNDPRFQDAEGPHGEDAGGSSRRRDVEG